jgi:4-amino-4-deoxy-L-arabinose transferase-like glycosyltransferase
MPAEPSAGIREVAIQRWIAVGVAALYTALTIAVALTKRPWSDEGWFANAPFTLVTKGWMGTTALEPAGFLEGINQYTYWVMPLHLLLQAAWYKIFGFSLLSMRSISLVFGLVALVSWFLIMKSFSGSNNVGLLAAALLALDYNFIMSSSFGRMDLMCASLGAAGLASYLTIRKRNLTLAVTVSNCLVVASGMTHHLGILPFFGLIFLILSFDRKRLQWRHLGYAITPYVLALVAWSFYILKSPRLFIAQLSGNATTGNRLGSLKNPLMGLSREITERYFTGFGLGPHSMGHSGPIRLKVIILLTYVVAFLGVLMVGEIRKHRGYRTLLILAAMFFTTLAIWDGQKETWYLIHVIPAYTAILAVWITWCWNKRFAPKWLLVAAVVGFVGLQLGGVLQRIRLDNYHRSYLPAVDFLRSKGNNGQLIMGSSELGFGLGSFDHLVDDSRLGFYSGKKADFIVVEEVYKSQIDAYETKRPDLYRYINSMLTNEYQKIYDHELYQIYARRESQPEQSSAQGAH